MHGIAVAVTAVAASIIVIAALILCLAFVGHD
jgi:hypothetical protein